MSNGFLYKWCSGICECVTAMLLHCTDEGNRPGPDYSGHCVNQAHGCNEIMSPEEVMIIWTCLCGFVVCDIMNS
jgi:hypothetical protein